MEDPGFGSWSNQLISLYSKTSKRDLRPTQPHIQWVLVIASSGVKRPRPDAGNSSPFNANIKNDLNIAKEHANVWFQFIMIY